MASTGRPGALSPREPRAGEGSKLPDPALFLRRDRSAPGCHRGAVLGCGALVLVFAVGALFLASRGDELLRWSFERAESNLMARLSPKVGEDQRQRLHRAFEAAILAAVRADADPAAASAVRAQLESLAEIPEVGPEQISELIRALEAMASPDS